VDASGIVADGCAYVFDADAGGFEGGHGLLKFGFVAGQFFDVLLGGAQTGGCGGVAFIEEIEGVDGGGINFFGIGEDALLGFEALVFAWGEMSAGDLAGLESPEVEEAHAVLLVMFERGDAFADLLPASEGGR